MPKTQNKWSEEVFWKRVREGRGQGSLESYIPWILVQEITSKGISARILGIKTGRLHHLFSRNEIAYFYLLEWNDTVLDIQEQYPLLCLERKNPIVSVDIAASAGIRHPRDPKSHYPYVCTSDFRLVTQEGIKVRSIKEKKDLSAFSVRQKQEIERRFWLERNTDWKIISEEDIDFQKADNIAWVFNRCRTLAEYLQYASLLTEKDDAVDCFAQAYNNSKTPISTIAGDLEELFGFEQGAGICVFAQAVADRKIRVDMSSRFDMTSLRKA